MPVFVKLSRQELKLIANSRARSNTNRCGDLALRLTRKTDQDGNAIYGVMSFLAF
jgi:hypothetical protein